jgi:excisionase family DNA binding protein
MTRDITNEWLTTNDCADLLGVSTGFVRGEIREGRLSANQLHRPGKRVVYRIAAPDFKTYLLRHWRPISTGKSRAQSA